MTLPTIHHIVFDIGHVLVHYDPHLPFLRTIPDEQERKWFFDNICTPAWNLEQDRGRSWAEAEAELISRYPEYASLIRSFRGNWLEMVPHAHDRSVEMMLALIDAGKDVTLLTNFAADTFVEARGRFGFLDRPRGVTVSGAVGLIKPDRAIYDHHVRSFGLTPENTLFIDDVAANVQGAKNAGWQAVQFTGPDKLQADLAAYGLHF